MKVAIVTSFPRDPQAPRGGVEAVSVNLVRGLAGLGDLDVHVVTADRDVSQPQSAGWEGATIHRIARGDGSTLSNALHDGRRNVQAALNEIRPDVVHAHDTYGLMVRGHHGPRVFTVHGFIHADTRLSGTRLAPLRAWLWKRVETRGWREQPHIVSISPYVRERLTGIAAGVIHDIENPIAAEFFDIPRNERPGVVFYAGVIGRRKNALGLVEAFAKATADGVAGELRIAGPDGEADYMHLVRTRVAALGLTDRVHFLGNLDSTQLRRELAAASVFALVSLEEGAPMGVAEAMAAAVPVLASNRCGMPYMVRDGETGYLVDPTDVADIAWRLRELLADAALRTRMGQTGRAAALDRFHPTIVARRTREVYRRALRDGNRNGHSG
jgi:glycosyltransferase involved in cell wall biosynthesis